MTITSITPLLTPGATVVAAPYAPAGPIIAGTSATPNDISIGGSYTFAMDQVGLGFVAGVRIRAAATDDVTQWIEGIVTSFDEINLVVASDLANGFGVHSGWNINVTGQPGKTGAKGDTGPQGIQGPPFGAPIDSPFFTGNPQAPTPLAGDNDNTIATTAFVTTAVAFGKIDPIFTGDPKAPTPPPGDNDTSIATTAFVQGAITTSLGSFLISPSLTGTPTAPTPPAGDNSTRIATTAFVANGFAPINNPTFTGDPHAPTPAAADNDTSIATTAFVQRAVALLAPLASPAFTGTPSSITPPASSNDASLATTAFVYNATLPLATLISPSFTGTPHAPTPGAASTDGSLATTQFVKTAIQNLAPLSNPYFIGLPTAPTQPFATSDGTLATTQFCHNGFQPLNADLSALSGLSGAGVMYYRSSAGAWSPVEMGANMTFSGGTLSSAGGGGGTGGISDAPSDGTYYSRRNLTWAPNPMQGDAPSDTNPYVRVNATWSMASAAGIAMLNSPALTGSPTAPTVSPSTDSTTKLATTAFVQNSLGSYAPINSPAFTGVPTAPPPPAISNDTTIATTAFVKTATSTLAPLAGPVFTGDARAVTPLAGDNDTSIATTAFVQTAISGKADSSAVAATYAPLASPTFTGDAKAVTPATGDNDTSIATTQFVARDFAPLASPTLSNPTFTGTAISTTPAHADNTTKVATTAFVQDALTTLPPQGSIRGGQLSYVSATSLKFVPFRGRDIIIQGTIYAIPTSGIAGLANTGVFVNGVAGQNLAANTSVPFYYVYAFNNGGVVTADFSTTTHATSATAGNVGTEIKSGDDTRSLIGMIRTSVTAQFVDSLSQRFVRSWFNTVKSVMRNNFTADRSTGSTSFTELNAEIRCEFLIWANEPVIASLVGSGNCSTATRWAAAIGFNSNTADPGGVSQNNGSATSGVVAVTSMKTGLAEGYNWATALAQSLTGGSGTVMLAAPGSANIPEAPVFLSVALLGPPQ